MIEAALRLLVVMPGPGQHHLGVIQQHVYLGHVGLRQPVNEAEDLSEQRSWDPRTSYVRFGS